MQNIRGILGVTFDAFKENDQGVKTKKSSAEILDEYNRLKRRLYDKYDNDEITDDEYNRTLKSLDGLYTEYMSTINSHDKPAKELSLTDIKDFIDPALLQDSMFLNLLAKYKSNLKTKADIQAFVEKYKTEKKEIAYRIFGSNVDYIDEDLWGDEIFQKYYARYELENYTPDELTDFIKDYRRDILKETPDNIEKTEITDNGDHAIW